MVSCASATRSTSTDPHVSDPAAIGIRGVRKETPQTPLADMKGCCSRGASIVRLQQFSTL